MEEKPSPSLLRDQSQAIHHPQAKFIVIGTLLIALVVGAAGYWFIKNGNIKWKIACTKEAKQCPDGSYVEKAGPNCEFAECATSVAENEGYVGWSTYQNVEHGFEMRHPVEFGGSKISLDTNEAGEGRVLRLGESIKVGKKGEIYTDESPGTFELPSNPAQVNSVQSWISDVKRYYSSGLYSASDERCRQVKIASYAGSSICEFEIEFSYSRKALKRYYLIQTEKNFYIMSVYILKEYSIDGEVNKTPDDLVASILDLSQEIADSFQFVEIKPIPQLPAGVYKNYEGSFGFHFSPSWSLKFEDDYVVGLTKGYRGYTIIVAIEKSEKDISLEESIVKDISRSMGLNAKSFDELNKLNQKVDEDGYSLGITYLSEKFSRLGLDGFRVTTLKKNNYPDRSLYTSSLGIYLNDPAHARLYRFSLYAPDDVQGGLFLQNESVYSDLLAIVDTFKTDMRFPEQERASRLGKAEDQSKQIQCRVATEVFYDGSGIRERSDGRGRIERNFYNDELNTCFAEISWVEGFYEGGGAYGTVLYDIDRGQALLERQGSDTSEEYFTDEQTKKELEYQKFKARRDYYFQYFPK